MIKMEIKQKKEKKYRYKFIQFSVSDDLKNDIEEWTGKSSFNTISDFVRNAVVEKIRNLKNPKLNQSNLKDSQINASMLEQLTKNTQKLILLQEKTIDRSKIFDEMKADLERIKKFSIKQGLVQESEIIYNLLKAHQSLSQKQIIEKTNLEKDTIFQILSTDDRFKLNIKGRFCLK